jgi:hypothetical protein
VPGEEWSNFSSPGTERLFGGVEYSTLHRVEVLKDSHILFGSTDPINRLRR